MAITWWCAPCSDTATSDIRYIPMIDTHSDPLFNLLTHHFCLAKQFKWHVLLFSSAYPGIHHFLSLNRLLVYFHMQFIHSYVYLCIYIYMYIYIIYICTYKYTISSFKPTTKPSFYHSAAEYDVVLAWKLTGEGSSPKSFLEFESFLTNPWGLGFPEFEWNQDDYWLVVRPPLWKIWVRQLGWWLFPIYMYTYIYIYMGIMGK